jgi:probable HAF family extracellular repeat protein
VITISNGLGINNAGQVVGSYSNSVTIVSHAYLYSAGQFTDLNSLIPPGSGWVLNSSAAINDAGQIVGDGTYNGQISQAYLLTPIK